MWLPSTATPIGALAPEMKLGLAPLPSGAARPIVVPLPPPWFAQYTNARAGAAITSAAASDAATAAPTAAPTGAANHLRVLMRIPVPFRSIRADRTRGPPEAHREDSQSLA